MADVQAGDSPQGFDDPTLWADIAPAGADSPPADTPPADADAATTPEAATEPPTTTPDEGEEGNRQPQGPIPFERHKAILDGAYKERDDLRAKWERVAWAEKLAEAGATPDQIQQAYDLYRGIDGDPAGFLERFYEQLRDHPALAPQVRSWAAKVLAGGRRAESAAEPTDTEPQPDYRTEDGTPFYSGPQLRKWQEWHQRRLDAALDAKIGPLQQTLRAQEDQQRQAQQQRAIYDATAKELEAYRQKPYFKDHEADIKAYLASRNYEASLAEAYAEVLSTKVLPSLSSTEQAKTLAKLKTQAAASSVNPKAAAPSTPADLHSFHDERIKWT